MKAFLGCLVLFVCFATQSHAATLLISVEAEVAEITNQGSPFPNPFQTGDKATLRFIINTNAVASPPGSGGNQTTRISFANVGVGSFFLNIFPTNDPTLFGGDGYDVMGSAARLDADIRDFNNNDRSNLFLEFDNKDLRDNDGSITRVSSNMLPTQLFILLQFNSGEVFTLDTSLADAIDILANEFGSANQASFTVRFTGDFAGEFTSSRVRFDITDVDVTAVPIPASMVMFASGVFGLGIFRKRLRRLSTAA